MKNVFSDNKLLLDVSHAYVVHQKILYAILGHKDENKYLTERKGKRFGAQSRFVTTPEGDVVMVVLEPLEYSG